MCIRDSPIDLAERIDLRRVGKRALESMVKVGCFDEWGTRPQMIDALDRMIGHSGSTHAAAAVGQLTLFGGNGGSIAVNLIRSEKDAPKIDRRQLLDWEKELIGVYPVSYTHLDVYKRQATHDDTKYALGSVLNHVLMHQTIIGQEALLQLEMAGDDPDVIVGCTGGGSNFAGIAFPFLGQQLRGGKKRRIVAVEPAACPSLTRGKFAYDFGDTAHLTPLTKMHTLGSTFTPPGFHAGGLRYHGMAPLVSHLKELNLIEATAYTQNECFAAGVLFARAEGILPAPEANHAVKGAIVEALRCKAEGRSEVILFNLCGHGHFDMSAYSNYMAGNLVDQAYDENELAMALAGLPSVPA